MAPGVRGQAVLFSDDRSGELTQAVLQWEHQPGPEQRRAVGQEVFDVIWNAVNVANRMGLDITDCFHDKMAIHASRQWPD